MKILVASINDDAEFGLHMENLPHKILNVPETIAERGDALLRAVHAIQFEFEADHADDDNDGDDEVTLKQLTLVRIYGKSTNWHGPQYGLVDDQWDLVHNKEGKPALFSGSQEILTWARQNYPDYNVIWEGSTW